MRLLPMMAIAGVTLAPVVQVRHSDAAEGPTVSISWQSAGDSYSSGEGVAGNRGDCAQSPAAYGPVAADLLRHEYGWSIPNETFTACTGAVSAEYLDRVGDPDKGTTLWQWGREQGAPERVDIITMSFGGNDIGFKDALLDCLPLPEKWTDLLGPPGTFALTGCDFDESDLEARIDSLLGPSTPQQQSMPDFYEQIVDRALTASGHLYVVGYPRIFAPVSEWPGWIKVSCQGVFRGDAERLGRLADRLNATLSDAVDEVNSRIGSNRVHFVDRAAAYRDGGHELCGTGDDWLNGIALDRGDGSLRLETSFHPNAAGHAAVARVLVDQVATTYEPPAPDTAFDFTCDPIDCFPLPSACHSACDEETPGGMWPVPSALGPVTFFATIRSPEDACNGYARTVVLTAAITPDTPTRYRGLWQRELPCVDALEVSWPISDSTGHAFIHYSDGNRYSGVIVLDPDAGFRDFGSLPSLEPWGDGLLWTPGRFYPGDIIHGDTNVIVTTETTCEPTCADGPSESTYWVWDGSDYVPES